MIVAGGILALLGPTHLDFAGTIEGSQLNGVSPNVVDNADQWVVDKIRAREDQNRSTEALSQEAEAGLKAATVTRPGPTVVQ